MNSTKSNSQRGRVSLGLLALVLMFSGLMLDQWWWKVGGIILVVMFVEAFYRYRSLN